MKYAMKDRIKKWAAEIRMERKIKKWVRQAHREETGKRIYLGDWIDSSGNNYFPVFIVSLIGAVGGVISIIILIISSL